MKLLEKITGKIYEIEEKHKLVFRFGILILFMFAILNILFISRIYGFPEKISYEINSIKVIPALLGVMCITYLVYSMKKLSAKLFLWITIFVVVAFSGYYVANSSAISFIDQKDILLIGEALAKGQEIPAHQLEYWKLYPHQTGYISYVKDMYSIFGSNAEKAIQYANIIFLVMIIIGISRITEHIWKDSTKTKIAILLTGIFTPIVFLTTFVYGDLPSLALVLMGISGILEYTKTKRKIGIIQAFLAISLAVLLRKNAIIIAFGVLIYLVYILFVKEKKEFFKKVAIVLTYILAITVPIWAFKIYYMQKIGVDLKGGIPSIAYMYMASEKKDYEPGWWTGRHLEIYYDWYGQDGEKLKREMPVKYISLVVSKLTNPSEFIDFYGKKLASTWLESTHAGLHVSKMVENAEFVDGKIKDERAKKIESNYFINSLFNGWLYEYNIQHSKALEIVIYGFSTIAVYLVIFKRKNENTGLDYIHEIKLLLLVFIMGVAFHLIWETKSRYVTTYVVMLIPIATYGLGYSMDKLGTMIDRKKSGH